MDLVNKPQKKTVVLDKTPQNYKPKSSHDHEVSTSRNTACLYNYNI